MARPSVLFFVLMALILTAAASAQVKSLQEEQDYAFALGLFKDRNYQLATEKFRQFTTTYPESHLLPDAEYYVAESLYQNGNLNDASIGFEAFQQRYPDSKLADDAGFREGEVYFRQNLNRKAHEQFASVVKRYPEGNLAHESAYWAGEAAFRDGNYPMAMRYYRIAYEHYPEGRIRDYAYFSIGFVLEKEGSFEQALANYEDFLKLFPASTLTSSVFTRKGACLFQLSQYQPTIDWLTSLTDSPDPENAAERLFLRGEARYKLGQHAEAEALYASFLTGYPGNKRSAQVQYSMGWTQIEQKKYSEAIATFDELSQREGALAEAALFRKGMALRLNGNLEVARTVFKDMISTRPSGEYADNAHFELGMAAYNEKTYQAALEHFRLLTGKFPASDIIADAWFMQGETLLRLRNPADAAAAFGSAASIESIAPELLAKTMFRQGYCLFQSQQYAEAVIVLKNFLQKYPGDSRKQEALIWLGESHFKNEEFEDAVIVYNQLLASSPTPDLLQDALYGLGWAHFRMQRFADAEQAFKTLTTDYRAGKHDVDANLRLGDAQYAQKKFAEAAKTYRYTSRMYAGNPLAAYALLQLASSEHRLKKTPSAISTLRGMLSRYPDSEFADKAQFSLAWMYFQSKDYTVAIEEFEKLIRSYSSSPLLAQSAYSIADCYYNQGEYPQAEENYRRVLSEHPESPLVSDALEGLSQTLRLQGREEEAARVKQEWLASHPKSSAADKVVFDNLRDLCAQGDPVRCIPALQGFITAHPESTLLQEAHLLLGEAYRENGDLEDAERTLRACIGMSARSDHAIRARFALMETAMAQQDRNKALAIGEEMLKESYTRGYRSQIYYRRGLAYRADKDFAAARTEFESARSAQPQDRYAALARVEIAVLTAEEGQLEKALDELRAIATTRVDVIGAEAQYRMGSLLVDAKRNDEATEAFLRVGYVFKDSELWNAKALLSLGRIKEAGGDRAGAKEHYQKVVVQYGGTNEAREAERRLEILQ